MLQHYTFTGVYSYNYGLDTIVDRCSTIVCDSSSQGQREAKGSTFDACRAWCYVSLVVR